MEFFPVVNKAMACINAAPKMPMANIHRRPLASRGPDIAFATLANTTDSNVRPSHVSGSGTLRRAKDSIAVSMRMTGCPQHMAAQIRSHCGAGRPRSRRRASQIVTPLDVTTHSALPSNP